MHPDQGPGLSLHDLGETGGSDTVTLLSSEMPIHTHALMAVSASGADRSPANEALAKSTGGALYGPATGLTPLAGSALAPIGASFPHNNMMPYLTLNFCIALQGVFPPR
jgi:microcystin-dependent protein